MHVLIKLLLSALIIAGISGCLPFEYKLQKILTQNNITKKIFLKNYAIAYDDYHLNKNEVVSLLRAESYNIVDIKEGYARLEKNKNNKLLQDVWVDINSLEIEPTYFLTITTNTTNAKLIIQGQTYKENMRLQKGTYVIDISADEFLDKKLSINIDQDIHKNISLDFDVEAKKRRIIQQKKLAKEKALKEKVAHEIKTHLYIDKQQKLTWQDNNKTMSIQKKWITQVNYDKKNYSITNGDTAVTYCKNLKLAGYNNWRLPSKDELKILHKEKRNLKNTTSRWYRSATGNEKIKNRAWAIFLNNGDGYSDNKNAMNYVRCVR